MKRCSKCLEWKPKELYKKNKASKDGLYASCKPCNKRSREGLLPLRLVKEEELLKQGLKKCYSCEEIKPISEYHKHKNYEHGLHYVCRECANKRTRENYSPVVKQVYHANKCAKAKNLKATLTPEQWFTIRDRFKNDKGKVCCAYCKREEKDENKPHHIEHFIPLAEEGGTVMNNVLPVCSYCNMGKREMDFIEWCLDYFPHFNIEGSTVINTVYKYFEKYHPEVLDIIHASYMENIL